MLFRVGRGGLHGLRGTGLGGEGGREVLGSVCYIYSADRYNIPIGLYNFGNKPKKA